MFMMFVSLHNRLYTNRSCKQLDSTTDQTTDSSVSLLKQRYKTVVFSANSCPLLNFGEHLPNEGDLTTHNNYSHADQL